MAKRVSRLDKKNKRVGGFNVFPPRFKTNNSEGAAKTMMGTRGSLSYKTQANVHIKVERMKQRAREREKDREEGHEDL